MFEQLRCKLKGHQFVDSRSQPGTVVCLRCRHRETFQGVNLDGVEAPPQDPPGAL